MGTRSHSHRSKRSPLFTAHPLGFSFSARRWKNVWPHCCWLPWPHNIPGKRSRCKNWEERRRERRGTENAEDMPYKVTLPIEVLGPRSFRNSNQAPLSCGNFEVTTIGMVPKSTTQQPIWDTIPETYKLLRAAVSSSSQKQTITLTVEADQKNSTEKR